jgi:hypothetical protein
MVNANFDAVFALARSELFMWAADDDAHEPDYISHCVAELDANKSAVLAASDARQIHPTRGDVGIHSLSPGLSSPNPPERLRALLRHGGWTAIYGVIRRNALERCRAISRMTNLPAPGISTDYSLIELLMMGPIASIPQPLFRYTVREPMPPQDLSLRLNPAPVNGALTFWIVRDFWRLCRRHRLSQPESLPLFRELLEAIRTPGSLHDELVRYNRAFLPEAYAQRQYRRAAALYLERLLLRP